MTDIFPIAIPCDDRGHSALSFQPYFLAAKPKTLTWYGYDVIIHSPTEVEFVTYDMLDNCYGGLGRQTDSFKVTVPESATARAIDHKINRLATLRRAKELRETENVIIARYADELRAELTRKKGDQNDHPEP